MSYDFAAHRARAHERRIHEAWEAEALRMAAGGAYQAPFPDFRPPPQLEMTFRFTRAEIEAATDHKTPCADGQPTDKQGAEKSAALVSESPTRTRSF